MSLQNYEITRGMIATMIDQAVIEMQEQFELRQSRTQAQARYRVDVLPDFINSLNCRNTVSECIRMWNRHNNKEYKLSCVYRHHDNENSTRDHFIEFWLTVNNKKPLPIAEMIADPERVLSVGYLLADRFQS